MIRHIVLFNAKDPKDKPAILEGLKMLETIKGNWTLQVRENIKTDQIGNDVDFVVYGEFPDLAALERYKADPLYAEAIRIVRPLRDMRVAVDVEAA
jgi:hypothetical protein